MEELNVYVCAFALKFFLYIFFPLFLPSTILLVFSHFGMCVGVVYERVRASVCVCWWLKNACETLVWGGIFWCGECAHLQDTSRLSLCFSFTLSLSHTQPHSHAGADTSGERSGSNIDMDESKQVRHTQMKKSHPRPRIREYETDRHKNVESYNNVTVDVLANSCGSSSRERVRWK